MMILPPKSGMTTDTCDLEEPSLPLKLQLKHDEDSLADEDKYRDSLMVVSKVDPCDSPRSTSLIVQDEEVPVTADTSYAGFTHVLSCPMCNFLTLSISLLQQHAVGHASRSTIVRYSTFTCQKCSCLSTERGIMLEHIKIYHRNAQNPVRLIEERHTLSVDSGAPGNKLLLNNNNTIATATADNNNPKQTAADSRAASLLNTIFEKCQPKETSLHRNGFTTEEEDAAGGRSNGTGSRPTTPGDTPLALSISSGSSSFPLIAGGGLSSSGEEAAIVSPKLEGATVQGSRRRKLNNPGRFQTGADTPSCGAPTSAATSLTSPNTESPWPPSPPILTSSTTACSTVKQPPSSSSSRKTPHSAGGSGGPIHSTPCKKPALADDTSPPLPPSAADLELIRRATATAHAEAARDSSRVLATTAGVMATSGGGLGAVPTGSSPAAAATNGGSCGGLAGKASRPRVRKPKTSASKASKSGSIGNLGNESSTGAANRVNAAAAAAKVAAFLTNASNHGLLASIKRDAADYETDTEQALDMTMKSCSKSSPSSMPGNSYHLPASSQLIEMASRLSPHHHSLTSSMAAALTSEAANGGLITSSDVADVLHRLGAASALFHQLRGSTGSPAAPIAPSVVGGGSPAPPPASPSCPSPLLPGGDQSDTECSSPGGGGRNGYSLDGDLVGGDSKARSSSGGGGRSRGKNCGGGSRPHRQNFTPTQNKILMEWYQEHKDKPYPSTEETNMLTKRSDLTYPQVKKWFANKRARTSLCIKKSPRSGDQGDDAGDCDDIGDCDEAGGDMGGLLTTNCSSRASSVCSDQRQGSSCGPFLFPTAAAVDQGGDGQQDEEEEEAGDTLVPLVMPNGDSMLQG